MNDESKFSVDEILKRSARRKPTARQKKRGVQLSARCAGAELCAEPVEPAYAAEPNTPEESEKQRPG